MPGKSHLYVLEKLHLMRINLCAGLDERWARGTVKVTCKGGQTGLRWDQGRVCRGESGGEMGGGGP